RAAIDNGLERARLRVRTEQVVNHLLLLAIQQPEFVGDFRVGRLRVFPELARGIGAAADRFAPRGEAVLNLTEQNRSNDCRWEARRAELRFLAGEIGGGDGFPEGRIDTGRRGGGGGGGGGF